MADLTLDMPFLFHPLLDIVPYGAQHSTLSAPVTRAAEHLGIAIGDRSDPGAGPVHPQRPLQLRAPGRSVALHQERLQDRGFGADGAAINAGYRRDVYHKPNDDMSQPFDFEAGAQHARLNFLTGWLVAQETARPAWNPGDFFGELFGGAASAGPAKTTN